MKAVTYIPCDVCSLICRRWILMGLKDAHHSQVRAPKFRVHIGQRFEDQELSTF